MFHLISLFLLGLIVYYLIKNVQSIWRTITGTNHQQQFNNQQNNRQQQQPQQEPDNKGSKNRIILDDEGEYVDFEEVKDDHSKTT